MLKKEIIDELCGIAERLEALYKGTTTSETEHLLKPIKRIASDVGKAWSGSWLGYQANVYYESLQPPPPGAHFSAEWGIELNPFVNGTTGRWCEYRPEDIRLAILSRAGNPDLSSAQKHSEAARQLLQDSRADLLSILEIFSSARKDPILEQIKQNIKKISASSKTDEINRIRPQGSFTTRDSLAHSQNLRVPPHLDMIATIDSIWDPYKACIKLSKMAREAIKHINRIAHVTHRTIRSGKKVFIGHGRSAIWRDLKDFLQDRLNLPWDEFNRVPIAGVTNIGRLSQMLDDAAIALLVMTAEDERPDGKHNARLNVVHEAGLFQGHLGFTRAIVLLEDECEDFSNIHGLGQIRFPKGNIAAIFEEIRRVLEREQIIEDDK